MTHNRRPTLLTGLRAGSYSLRREPRQSCRIVDEQPGVLRALGTRQRGTGIPSGHAGGFFYVWRVGVGGDEIEPSVALRCKECGQRHGPKERWPRLRRRDWERASSPLYDLGRGPAHVHARSSSPTRPARPSGGYRELLPHRRRADRGPRHPASHPLLPAPKSGPAPGGAIADLWVMYDAACHPDPLVPRTDVVAPRPDQGQGVRLGHASAAASHRATSPTPWPPGPSAVGPCAPSFWSPRTSRSAKLPRHPPSYGATLVGVARQLRPPSTGLCAEIAEPHGGASCT
jgi:hypothetical protein